MKIKWLKISFIIVIIIAVLILILSQSNGQNIEKTPKNASYENTDDEKNESEDYGNRVDENLTINENIDLNDNNTDYQYHIHYIYTNCQYCKQGKEDLETSNLKDKFDLEIIYYKADENTNNELIQNYKNNSNIYPAYIITANISGIIQSNTVKGYVNIENIEYILCIFDNMPDFCENNSYVKQG